MLVLYIYQKVK